MDDPAHLVTFASMLLMSAVISTLTKRLQQQKTMAAHQAHLTSLLLGTSQKLQGARNSQEIIDETGRQLTRLLGRTVVMYPEKEGRLGAALVMGAPKEEAQAGELSLYLGKEEKAVAAWSLRNRKQAGAGTQTLPGARCLYWCIRGREEALGVVAVTPLAAGMGADLVADQNVDRGAAPAALSTVAASFPLDSFEKGLLTAVLSECALALEKERIRESKDNILIQAKHEALRANLLRAISHDLRTPLTSISGNAQMLRTKGQQLTAEVHQRLCADMCADAAWLISLVENILAVTRLEDGSVPLALEVEVVGECIQKSLGHMLRRSEEHHLQVRLEDDMLLARMDARLIVQVLVNMVDNAVKYTPPGSTITVAALRNKDMVELSVADDGPGLPDVDRERLFDMFFTLPQAASDSRRGLGLGLYLCKSIVAAHGGCIRVEDNSPSGSIFTFTLPLAEVDYA